MKKTITRCAALMLALVLLVSTCPLHPLAAGQEEITYQGVTGEGNDDYMGEPLDVYWLDASVQHPDDYTKIVGYRLTVKWTEAGYYGGWAETKENPMGMVLTTKGAHAPGEYVFDYSNGQTPVYALSDKEIHAFAVGEATFIVSMAFQSATELEGGSVGDVFVLTYEGDNTALFCKDGPIMTVLSYLGGFEYIGVEWILGEPEESPDDKWERVETTVYPDIPTVSDDLQNGCNYVDITVPNLGKSVYPVILWIHGGGYITGDRKNCLLNNTKEYLLSQGYAFVSAEYTLTAADYSFGGMPQMLHDIKAAVRFLRAHAEEYRLDTRFIAAMGESAGAGLALLLGTTNGLPDYEDLSMGNDAYSSGIQAMVSFCGPSNFTGQYIGNMAAYLGVQATDGTYTDEELEELAKKWSPTALVNKNTPAMFLAYSKEDTTVVLSHGEEMYEAAKKCMDKTDIKKMFYTKGGHVDRGTFDSYQAYTTLAAWLNEKSAAFLNDSPSAPVANPTAPVPTFPAQTQPDTASGLVLFAIVLATAAIAIICVYKKKRK